MTAIAAARRRGGCPAWKRRSGRRRRMLLVLTLMLMLFLVLVLFAVGLETHPRSRVFLRPERRLLVQKMGESGDRRNRKKNK